MTWISLHVHSHWSLLAGEQRTAIMCAEEDPITAGAAGAVLKRNY
jgi:hypothetical protein